MSKSIIAIIAAAVLGVVPAAAALGAGPGPPRPVITAHPAKATTSKSARFVVTEKQKNTHLGCKLVKGSRVINGAHPCTSPVSYHNLKPAKYTFQVFAYPNGQCNGPGHPCNGSQNASFSWTIK